VNSHLRKVLLTGHKGYIGGVLAGLLSKNGYDVTGLDCGYYADGELYPPSAVLPEIQKDLRDLAPSDVRGFDAVIHLAALSNDPINHDGSMRLAEFAKSAGVQRFLFSSSCIMYGMSDLAVVDETSPLAPQTEYARSKVRSEEGLHALAGPGFSPVFLRNGTIYGPSPFMRLDTVLNDLVSAAFTTGKVTLLGDGTPWRPVTHVEDVARYFQLILEAPVEKIHNQAFNCGAEQLNHQMIELAHFVVDAVPGCKLEVLNQTSSDRRTYKADFSKFKRTFPDFTFQWNARSGAKALYETFAIVGLTREDVTGSRFVRLRTLQSLIERERLDASLRFIK